MTDADAAPTELFTSYEAELRLLQADISQKLDQISELSQASSGNNNNGNNDNNVAESRKTLIRQSERALDEARELLDQMRLEKANVSGTGAATAAAKTKMNQQFRNLEADVDGLARRLKQQSSPTSGGGSAKGSLFGARYTDNPSGASAGTEDEQLAQRQQLLSGTDRLERSSGRLRDSHRVALETEDIGRNTLADLSTQRETIMHTRGTLLEAEGYTDRSIKTLRGMARR